MPIYEYVCRDCGNKFELLRPFSQVNKPAACPKCHKTAKKKLSTFASFSMSEGGSPTPIAGGSSCSTCGSSSCSTCGM